MNYDSIETYRLRRREAQTAGLRTTIASICRACYRPIRLIEPVTLTLGGIPWCECGAMEPQTAAAGLEAHGLTDRDINIHIEALATAAIG